MDVHTLEDIGLSKPQASAYIALIEMGSANAPAVAKRINESRSNAYKLLDKLCELGLVMKDQSGKQVHYYPVSPTSLQQLLQKEASDINLRERKLAANLPEMLNFFFAHTEQASIRYFQGKEGISQIYSQMLATGKPLYLLRSPEDVRFYDQTFFGELRKKRRLLGVRTIGITPDVSSANHDPKIDEQDKFTRTWIPADAYTANVEWNVSGDKLALISFGKEAIGIIIHSAQIAESFRQVFTMLEKIDYEK